MMRRITIFLALLLLGGCESSPGWFAAHPDKRTVEANGIEFTLAEGKLGWWVKRSKLSFGPHDIYHVG